MQRRTGTLLRTYLVATLGSGLCGALALSCAKAELEPATVPGDVSAGGAAGGNGRDASFVLPTLGDGGAFRFPDASGAAVVTEGGIHFGDGGGCNRLDVKFEREIPTVAIVVDRSSSMTERYGNGTRWDVLKRALLDPTTGLIKANQEDVRFGLAMYTSYASAPSCPFLGAADGAGANGTLDLQLGLGAYEKIRTVYEPAIPPRGSLKGETPTGEAIAAVTAALETYGEPGPKFILLATDGEPDTCPGNCTGNCPPSEKAGFPRDPNCGQDKSITAVQTAFGKGVKTFVLALGNDVGAEHLQSLANAGAGQPVLLGGQAGYLKNTCGLGSGELRGKYAGAAGMDARFFRPGDQDALGEALRAILASVRSCKFTLQGTVARDLAPQGIVTVDGRQLIYNDVNGWRMNSEQELELLGTACGAVQTKAKGLSVAFPCGIYKPIE